VRPSAFDWEATLGKRSRRPNEDTLHAGRRGLMHISPPSPTTSCAAHRRGLPDDANHAMSFICMSLAKAEESKVRAFRSSCDDLI
jgi:hypothetical protein